MTFTPVLGLVNFACAKRTFATMCKRLEVFSRIHMSASAYFVDFGKRLPISTESQNRIRYRRGSSNVWEGVQPALQPASWTAGSQRRYGGRQFEITGEELQNDCPLRSSSKCRREESRASRADTKYIFLEVPLPQMQMESQNLLWRRSFEEEFELKLSRFPSCLHRQKEWKQLA